MTSFPVVGNFVWCLLFFVVFFWLNFFLLRSYIHNIVFAYFPTWRSSFNLLLLFFLFVSDTGSVRSNVYIHSYLSSSCPPDIYKHQGCNKPTEAQEAKSIWKQIKINTTGKQDFRLLCAKSIFLYSFLRFFLIIYAYVRVRWKMKRINIIYCWYLSNQLPLATILTDFLAAVQRLRLIRSCMCLCNERHSVHITFFFTMKTCFCVFIFQYQWNSSLRVVHLRSLQINKWRKKRPFHLQVQRAILFFTRLTIPF